MRTYVYQQNSIVPQKYYYVSMIKEGSEWLHGFHFWSN